MSSIFHLALALLMAYFLLQVFILALAVVVSVFCAILDVVYRLFHGK